MGNVFQRSNGNKPIHHKKKEDTPASVELTAEERFERYRCLRDELFSNSLGAEAFKYVRAELEKDPGNAPLQALLGDTAAKYERTKNPYLRIHWIDRLDILHEGLSVTAMCIRAHPTYEPCYRAYVECAVKAAENEYFFTPFKPIGLLRNYSKIREKADLALELKPSVGVAMAMGTLSARAARDWWQPYAWLGFLFGIPSKSVLLDDAIRYFKIAREVDPNCLETTARMAQAYFALGNFVEARRWYSYVRDEMAPRTSDDMKWTGLAHTNLATHFPIGISNVTERSKWTLPFA